MYRKLAMYNLHKMNCKSLINILSICNLYPSSGSVFRLSSYQSHTSFQVLLKKFTELNVVGKRNSSTQVKTNEEPSMTQRAVSKIKDSLEPKSWLERQRLGRQCYYSYETMVDQVPVLEFFKELDLPDTFYSWFSIVELHVWLLSTRAMMDEEHGYMVRNRIIEAMWSDVTTRVPKLGDIAATVKKKEIDKLSHSFRAALIGYDEGVQKGDVALAAMVWRRFYGQECDDITKLERLVKYIRIQLTYLNSLTLEEIIKKQNIKWIPIKEITVV